MKRFAVSSTTLLCALASLSLSPLLARAGLTPITAGPTFGIDDNNTANLNPTPRIAVSTLPGGQCPWIESNLTAFETTHAGWSHVWAPAAEMAKVEAGLSIIDYYAWVVSEPTNITSANGVTWTTPDPPLVGNNNVHDVGGSVFNLKYDPANAAAGAHVFTDLHWVQGLSAYYDDYGAYIPGNFQTRLDTGPNNTTTPFYDTAFAAGQLAGGGGWFLDTPFKIETEALETNPVADVQFQVVLADFDSANKKVTLYGGYWWGYQYNATDVPEPASLAVLGLAGLTLLLRRPKKS